MFRTFTGRSSPWLAGYSGARIWSAVIQTIWYPRGLFHDTIGVCFELHYRYHMTGLHLGLCGDVRVLIM